MFVCGAAGFIHRNKGSNLVNYFLENVDCLIAFDRQGDLLYRRGVTRVYVLRFRMLNKLLKNRKTFINLLKIINIYQNYLKGIKRHINVW